MRCRCMNSLAKLLLDSSCAAARVGPKMGHSRRRNSSTTPSINGSSGPTTVRSGCKRLASSTTESRLLRSALTHSACCEIPPLPGAQYSCVTRGDCCSFQTRACSRPPLPRTSTFMLKKGYGFDSAVSNGGPGSWYYKQTGLMRGGDYMETKERAWRYDIHTPSLP